MLLVEPITIKSRCLGGGQAQKKTLHTEGFLEAAQRGCNGAFGRRGPEWGSFTQAKSTTAVGDGIFVFFPIAPGKQAFRAGQNAKKAPVLGAFLLVARRGFEPLLPG